MLFEALTGHVPFDRPTDISKIYAHVNDPIPSARDEVDGVPVQLDAIIAKAMAKRPEDRFGSAGELTVAIGKGAAELETAERVAAAPEPRPDATALLAPRRMTADATNASSPPRRRPSRRRRGSSPARQRIEPTATGTSLP